MIDIHDIEEKITSEIYKKIRELKTELFESSGTTLGRNWDDLTPKYKKWKQKIRGSAYPINIFTSKSNRQRNKSKCKLRRKFR